MSFAVEFAETARNDLVGILEYIAADNPTRASSFIEDLESHIRRRLEVFPRSGTRIGEYRFIAFRGYVAVYAINEGNQQVLVVLVAEGHREWRSAFE